MVLKRNWLSAALIGFGLLQGWQTYGYRDEIETLKAEREAWKETAVECSAYLKELGKMTDELKRLK